jgi:proliferating cell nuclear antigen
MIEAEIKVELFEKAIEMLNAITTECRLHVNPEGIYARVIDTANVAIVSVRIPSESFVKYNVIENDEIGVDISKVMNYVRWMRDEEISENVEIIRRGTKDLIIGIDGHKFTMETFDLATVRKDPNQPKIELPVRMEVSANKFINAVKAASIVSDRISFIVDKWEFVIKAVGEKESY